MTDAPARSVKRVHAATCFTEAAELARMIGAMVADVRMGP